MSLIDNTLTRVTTQTLLPAGRRVERITAHDLEGVAAMEPAAFKFPRSRGNFEDSPKPGHFVIVLCDGDSEIADYPILMPVVDKIHLLNVTVAPVWQRQGLGHWLLRLARALTLVRGLDSLLLEVHPSNAGAVALHHRNGFTEIGWCERYYPAENNTHEDAFAMHMVCETSGVEAA